MDINDLDDSEVKSLIESLKHPSRLFSFIEINEKLAAMFGQITISENIIGVIDGIEYVIHIYRGKRDPDRYSINLRFADKHHQLVRLDIGSNHTNPDGTKIFGDHIHIYNNDYPKRDSFAFSLKKHEFPNVENIVDAFSKFRMYTNINEA
ncbi:DUF6978 family protein [Enterococcus avium]|uniref:DUF6978 family protein n=1 Tax=Enterococcus avium TaxID=33945 RepID=UPI003D6A680B